MDDATCSIIAVVNGVKIIEVFIFALSLLVPTLWNIYNNDGTARKMKKNKRSRRKLEKKGKLGFALT